MAEIFGLRNFGILAERIGLLPFSNRRSGAQRGALENNFGQRFSWAPLAFSPHLFYLAKTSFSRTSKPAPRNRFSTTGSLKREASYSTRTIWSFSSKRTRRMP